MIRAKYQHLFQVRCHDLCEHAFKVLHQRRMGRRRLGGRRGWGWKTPQPRRSWPRSRLGQWPMPTGRSRRRGRRLTASPCTPVADRIALLERVLEEYNARDEDFAQAMSAGNGRADRLGRARRRPGPGRCISKARSRRPKTLHWEEIARHHPDHPRRDRGLRADHAVELADEPDRLQGGPGDCGGLHDGAETVGNRAVVGHRCCAEVCHAAGVPAGVFNLVNGTGPEVGARLSAHPGGGYGQLYRIDPRGHVQVAAGCGADGQARGAGIGRQIGQHHPAIGRSCGGGGAGVEACFGQYRAKLRCADADVHSARVSMMQALALRQGGGRGGGDR